MNLSPISLLGLLFLVSVIEIALMVFLLRSQWAQRIAVDVPNHRSLHTSATPRIGGLVMMPLVLLPAMIFLPGLRVIAVAGMALWFLSFLDDRQSLPVIVRLLAQAAIILAALVCSDFSFSPVLVGIIFLLLMWGANLYNFMDGADGLAGGMTGFGFFVYGIIAWQNATEISILCLLLSMSATSFLWFNFAPAKIFLGDAGSVPLGFIAAAIGISGWQQQLWAAWFPVLVFSPFIADATVTLLKRLLCGEQVWRAHRDHYYQRLVRMGWTHRRLALTGYALMAAVGITAIVLLKVDPAVQYVGLLFWVSLYALAMTLIDLRWKNQQANTGTT